jgi:hypothetical protein
MNPQKIHDFLDKKSSEDQIEFIEIIIYSTEKTIQTIGKKYNSSSNNIEKINMISETKELKDFIYSLKELKSKISKNPGSDFTEIKNIFENLNC